MTTIPLSLGRPLRNSTPRADAGVPRKDVKTLCSLTGPCLGLLAPEGRGVAFDRAAGDRPTQVGSQFDWGGRLPSGNGGVRRGAERPRSAQRRCPPDREAGWPCGGQGAQRGARPVVVICWVAAQHITNQSYARDNRLIPRRSSDRAGGLAPRCRLSPSSRCRRWEGSDCSSVEGLRELG